MIMKKALLFLSIVLMAALAARADVTINATNFPDAVFRSYLMSEYPSGVITTAQLNARTTLDLSYKGISDMTGVQYFTQLTRLDVYNNNLSTIDVSSNTKLTYLNVGYNKLTSISVNTNTALEQLYLQNNQLTYFSVMDHSALRTFWVNNNPNLTTLNCMRNAITNFDVRNCTALQALRCYENPGLSSIQGLETCTALTYLDCEDCAITSLSGLSDMDNLQTLLARNNKLTTLDVTYKSNLARLRVSGNTLLTDLLCYNCDLNSLDVSGCTALKTLKCYYNYSLDAIVGLADCTALTYLDCEDCAITSLPGVDNMTNLQTLWARNNRLTSLAVYNKSQLRYLRVSGNTDLEMLHCRSCNLTSLDVTNCTSMTELDCNSNYSLTSITGLSTCTALTYLSVECCALPSLDATFCPGLEQLYCYRNNLTSLNVTGLTKLRLLNCMLNYDLEEITGLLDCTKIDYLECSNCSISSLNLGEMSGLKELWCHDNLLTQINVSEHSELTKLIASDNPYLNEITCSNCALTQLAVYGCTNLEYLECEYNPLTELDITTCENLLYLLCNGNPLSELDVSHNHKLYYLWCNSNRLTSLDVSGCTEGLYSLDCRYNWISGTLDVSMQGRLRELACSGNEISQLTLGQHLQLTYLECNGNELTDLDVSGCSALEDLRCSGNLLTSLDVSGHSALQTLYAQSNLLTSVKVDNCRELVLLPIFYNNIQAGQMGQLVNALPARGDTDKGIIYAYVDVDPSDGSADGNVITTSQVNQAAAKNWDVYHWNWDSNGWEPYAGIGVLTGDVDDNGQVNIVDVTALIDALLNSNLGAINVANADVDGNGQVNIVDVTVLIDMLLSGQAGKIRNAQLERPDSSPEPLLPIEETVFKKPRR